MITAQQISRIIGKTNITKSHTYTSGRKGQGRRSTDGFSVHTGIEGVIVNYKSSYSNQLNDSRRNNAIQIITTTLTEAGFTLEESTIWPGAFVVKEGQ